MIINPLEALNLSNIFTDTEYQNQQQSMKHVTRNHVDSLKSYPVKSRSYDVFLMQIQVLGMSI